METEAEVIQTIREHLEGLFPRVCPNCGHRFATLQEFLFLTKRLGPPVSYDAEQGNWYPLRPIGIVMLANCPCGNTLGISSEGLTILQNWMVLNWARLEARRRGMGMRELLGYLHHQICRQVKAKVGIVG